MDNNVKDYLNTWIEFIVANRTATKVQSTDHLQFVADVTNAEGNAWFDAIAGLFESLGLTKASTYGALRNRVANTEGKVSQRLYAALLKNIMALPETSPVERALRIFGREQRIEVLVESIRVVRKYRSSLPEPEKITDLNQEMLIRRALGKGIDDLNLKVELLKNSLLQKLVADGLIPDA